MLQNIILKVWFSFFLVPVSCWGYIASIDSFLNEDLLLSGSVYQKGSNWTYLARYSPMGFLIWERIYDDESYSRAAYAMENDSTIAFRYRKTAKQFAMSKFNSIGQMLWSKDLGPADYEELLYGAKPIRISMDTFLLTFPFGNELNVWTLSKEGEILNKHKTASLQCESLAPWGTTKRLNDGSLYFFSLCQDFNTRRGYVARLNSNYQLQWERFLPDIYNPSDLIAVEDGLLYLGLASGGQTSIYRLFLGKLDVEGNLLWQMPLREKNLFYSTYNRMLDMEDEIWVFATLSKKVSESGRNQLLAMAFEKTTGKALREGILFKDYSDKVSVQQVKKADNGLWIAGDLYTGGTTTGYLGFSFGWDVQWATHLGLTTGFGK